MMASNIPDDLIEEILARVPATTLKRLRSTCKQWDTLFSDHRFTKKHFDKAPREFLVLILKEATVHSVNFNLSGIHDNIDPSIEVKGKTGKLFYNGIITLITQIFHCGGLLLCTTFTMGYGKGLMVYNPIMGQTRWIKPRTVYKAFDMYALGYKNNKFCCDNYKILRCCWGSYNNRVVDAEYEVYEFKSNTWKVLDDMSPHLEYTNNDFGVSLKGNTYWPTSYKKELVHGLLVRFDFTRERFQHLHLPFTPHCDCDTVALSTVREEQLVVLYQKEKTLEIWVTNKIDETKNVSWSMFFTIDLALNKFLLLKHSMSYMVDEENKVVMCCGLDNVDIRNTRFYIVGEHEFREVDHHLLGDYPNERISWKLLSYVPSLVQIL